MTDYESYVLAKAKAAIATERRGRSRRRKAAIAKWRAAGSTALTKQVDDLKGNRGIGALRALREARRQIGALTKGDFVLWLDERIAALGGDE